LDITAEKLNYYNRNGVNMPDTVKEETYQGKPVISVLTGIGRDGKEYWMSMGLAKAKAIDENIDRIRMFIDKHSKGNG
jgi:hypothetical protein